MADGVQLDNGDFMSFTRDLEHVPADAGANVVTATEISARNIKDSWREAWSGSEHLPGAERSITYDMFGTASAAGRLAGAAYGGASSVSAEIGPSLDIGQGPVVGLVEEGTATVAPRGYGAHALAEEIAGYEAGLGKAVGDVL